MTAIEAPEALEAERDAAALLLTIKAALKRRHVTDFEVWGWRSRSCARGWKRLARRTLSGRWFLIRGDRHCIFPFSTWGALFGQPLLVAASLAIVISSLSRFHFPK